MYFSFFRKYKNLFLLFFCYLKFYPIYYLIFNINIYKKKLLNKHYIYILNYVGSTKSNLTNFNSIYRNGVRLGFN